MKQNKPVRYRIDFRSLRKRADKTQREVALELEVATNTVAYWDTGRQPSTELLPALARLFGISIEELYGLPRP